MADEEKAGRAGWEEQKNVVVALVRPRQRKHSC